MEKITRERIQAREMLVSCGGDMVEALERLERAQDLFFNACQLSKVEKCQKIIDELKKGVAYV